MISRLSIILVTLLATACASYEKMPQSDYTLQSPYINEAGIQYVDLDRYLVFEGKDLDPNTVNWNKEISRIDQKPELSPRPFFGLKSLEDTLYISNRLIQLKKTLNFRDLGGITTQSGQQIKWGKLFRSGKWDEVSSSEIPTLEQMKIAKVIDLRTDGEVDDHPDQIPSESSIQWLHVPISGISYEDLQKTRKDIKKQSPEEFDGNGKMEESMLRFAREGKQDFKTVFDHILSTDPDSAVVYHCTAGKDRTGLMTALLLYSLGVDEQTIMDDYLLSNYYRHEKMERNAKLGARLLGIENESLRPIMEVRSSYIQTSYTYIQENYGGLDGYLKSMGIGEEEKEILRSRYLY